MNARTVRRSLWLAGFVCLWLPVLDDPPLQTGAYLLDVTGEAATVARIGAEPAVAECTVRDAQGAVVAAVRDESPVRRHALRVGGLRPGAAYRYTLTEGGREVAHGEVHTPPADDRAPVRFACLGDSGAQPWWTWLQTAPALHLPARWQWLPTSDMVTTIGAAVAAYHPDFLLHLGDIVYPKGLHAHYSAGLFRPFGDVMRDAPCYAVLGNHDVIDLVGLQALANLPPPANATTGDGRCFSFAWGSLRVIGLEANYEHLAGRLLAEHPVVRYLEQQLVTCTEPWVIVASHFPIRSASRAGNSPDLMLTVRPMLKKYAVALYLSGHDHCYQRFGPAEDGEPVPLVVSGGGGKSLYEVKPQKGAVTLVSDYEWCSVAIEAAKLEFRCHRWNGEVIDTLDLALPQGSALEELRAVNPARAARVAALARR